MSRANRFLGLGAARLRGKSSAWAVLFVLVVTGCDDDDSNAGAPAASASAGPAGLSAELAKKVLARVGERTITLGEYAETLERMDRFERLRYQTDDRRKQLLDEMVAVELLAAEAERRGLHKRPETRQLIRQMLRDEVLRDLRQKLPPLDELSTTEVRAYYEAHKKEFHEPERRRVAHIVMRDKARAKTVLREARAATPRQWGQLVKKYSRARSAETGVDPPLELAGDLGLVTPPSSEEGKNERVPEPVRRAVFEIEKIGEVYDELVEHEGRVHIVRLTGKSAARTRSFAEAERTIRVKLLRDKIREAEEKLEAELRKKYPVKIDRAALEKVRVPNLKERP